MMSRLRKKLAAWLWLTALGGPAFAIQTHKVELGFGGAYDGLARIERDAEGRLTFTDAQNGDAVTLSQLVGTGAQANTIIVAKERGQFDNLSQAYEAAPENGVIVVYPGEYTLDEPLTLGAKSCAFIALNARATRLVIDTTSSAIFIGAEAAPTGSEDWDDAETYAAVGHLVFDGFTIDASGDPAAVRIRTANMSAGSLTFRHCRFIASRALKTFSDESDGFSIGVRVAVERCEFEPNEGVMESAIALTSRSLSGEHPARYIIRDNVFNPPAAEPGEAAPLMIGVDLRGQHVSATVEGNTFHDLIYPILVYEALNGRADLLRNTIRLDNPGPELFLPALGITLGGGAMEYLLERNDILIRDLAADDARCAGVGMIFSDDACVVRSRLNIIDVTGPDADGAFFELDGSAEFELRTSEDIWDTADLTEGTLIVEPTGDRRFGGARVDGQLDARGGAIFNTDALNKDFQVKGETDPHMLFGDASTGRVGVGTNTPTEALTVVGSLALGPTPPTAGSGATGAIVLGSGATPAAATDAAQIYARDNAGVTELYVKDEAGNETLLSSHAEPPGGFRADDPMPHTITSRNEFIGREVIIYLTAAIRRLEQVTGERFIWVRDLPDRREWTRHDERPPTWVERRINDGR